jgi:hypothetical protein
VTRTAVAYLRSIATGEVTKLYRDNGAFILSYVTRLLKDRYLAEDVVQETTLRDGPCAEPAGAEGVIG